MNDVSDTVARTHVCNHTLYTPHGPDGHKMTLCVKYKNISAFIFSQSSCYKKINIYINHIFHKIVLAPNITKFDNFYMRSICP